MGPCNACVRAAAEDQPKPDLILHNARPSHNNRLRPNVSFDFAQGSKDRNLVELVVKLRCRRPVPDKVDPPFFAANVSALWGADPASSAKLPSSFQPLAVGLHHCSRADLQHNPHRRTVGERRAVRSLGRPVPMLRIVGSRPMPAIGRMTVDWDVASPGGRHAADESEAWRQDRGKNNSRG